MLTTHTQCRICGNPHLTPILDLGNQTLSCVFPAKDAKDPSQSPLELVKCDTREKADACGLVQLKHTADVGEMYGATYGYHSSLSPSMVKHLQGKVKQLVALAQPQEGDAILDIGCNDGTLLNTYGQYGKFARYGVDPSSEKFRHFFEKDIDVRYEFFSGKAAKSMFGERKCKIITSIAMFYDLDDPRSFVRDIANLLDAEGVWALELSYLPLLLSQLTYDQICHEHVTYYGLTELKYLTDEAGLKILDVSFNDMNGGSIYLQVAHKGAKYEPNTAGINEILAKESSLRGLEPFHRFSRRLESHRDEVREFFAQCSAAGKKVYGYGASTKGNIVLNYCGITKEMLPAIGDLNAEKNGLFTPATRIPILTHDAIKTYRPDYLFVLIWHFRSEVIRDEIPYLMQGGKLVFHLPRLHIIDKDNYQRYLETTFEDLAFFI